MVLNSICSIVKKAPHGRLFYAQCLAALALLFWIFSWLIPSHYLPWVVFENELSAFVSLGFAVAALLVRGGAGVKNNPYFNIGVVLLLTIFAQYFYGLITIQVLGLGYAYISAFAVAAIVGENYKYWFEDLEAEVGVFYILLVLSAILLSACIVVAQWLGVEREFPSLMAEAGGSRSFGNLGQPNNQGTLLATGVLLVDLLRRRKILTFVSCTFFLLLLISALAMTSSRTAILSAVLGAMVLLFLDKNIRNRLFTVGWFFSLPILYVAIPWLKKNLMCANEMVDIRIIESLSESPRLAIYAQLLKIIPNAPFVGYGWMQAAYAQSISASMHYVGFETNYGHNVILDIILWFGIPFGVILVLWFACVLKDDIRASDDMRRLAYIIFIPFVLHSFLEFPFAYSFFLISFAFVLGYLRAAESYQLDGSRIRKGLTNAILFFVGTGMVVIGLLIANDYMRLAEDFRILRFNSKNIGKIPDGFILTSPLILLDMRNSFEVFQYVPGPGVTPKMLAKIKYAALQEHWPSANLKLISQHIVDRNMDDAIREYMRFKNLYSPSIVKWGKEALAEPYCDSKSRYAELENFCQLVGSR